MDDNENRSDTDTEFQPPQERVASLDNVSEVHRVLYQREGNGFVLHPQVRADLGALDRELRLTELGHECEMLKVRNEIREERCRRLEHEAESAAGRSTVQPLPTVPLENSFSQQLAR